MRDCSRTWRHLPSRAMRTSSASVMAPRYPRFPGDRRSRLRGSACGGGMRVLVTGGVRSGKSFHAESLVLAASDVTYVAPGPTTEEDPDPDWAARVARHQERRP